MKIRADIASLLREGVPQAQICRQLRCGTAAVQRTREALRLTNTTTSCPSPSTLDAAFQQHTRPGADGHILWTGDWTSSDGTPVVFFKGTRYHARPIAFRIHHGRHSVGRVTTSCGIPACVAGRCLLDQPMRAREPEVEELYAQIFQSAS